MFLVSYICTSTLGLNHCDFCSCWCMHYYTSPILPLEIPFGPLWMPFGHPQDILWKSFGHPLDILSTSSQHLLDILLNPLVILWTSFGHSSKFLQTSFVFFFIKKALLMLLFFHSDSSTAWMFPVSWYHLSAQQHLRSESLWFLLMPMYALSIHPQSILWRYHLWTPLDALWHPLDILWTSSGHLLDILWTSSGILWSSSGHVLDILLISSRHSLYYFFIKKAMLMLLFFHSYSSTAWMFPVLSIHKPPAQCLRSTSTAPTQCSPKFEIHNWKNECKRC